MRTTLDLPEKLLNEAMDVSGARTKTMTVTLALQEFVRMNRMKRLLDYRGRINLELTTDRIRKERDKR